MTVFGAWWRAALGVTQSRCNFPNPFLPGKRRHFLLLMSFQIRNLVEGKSYKFRLRCCFSSKEVPAAPSASSMSFRDDGIEPEQLHWSAFGPPSDEFKVRAFHFADALCATFAA